MPPLYTFLRLLFIQLFKGRLLASLYLYLLCYLYTNIERTAYFRVLESIHGMLYILSAIIINDSFYSSYIIPSVLGNLLLYSY
jgi:hypothetical protein